MWKYAPKLPANLLFPDEVMYRNYRYSAYVTNLKLSAELIWELYRKRADAENRIKEGITTVRLKCFSIGSWVVKSGRKDVLKMSVAMNKRVWMDGLFFRSSNFSWNNVKT